VGGRPDLLPANATPPRHSLDGSQYTYQEHHSYSTTPTRFVKVWSFYAVSRTNIIPKLEWFAKCERIGHAITKN